MKLELKNISYYERGSEETPCYDATVYINGKKAIDVSNNGQGGCDRQYPIEPFTYKDIEKVNNYLAEKSGDDFEPLDTWCQRELFINQDKKLLKRTMKKNIMVFVNKEDIANGRYYLFKIQNNVMSLMAYIKDKYPQSIILNDMSFDEALKTFRNEVSIWKLLT